MEQYGITELARLFGISTEALRKYEAKGLLESARDQNNQFRKYDVWDIGMLTQIRNFREMAFSLNEVNRLIQDGELSELEAALQEKKDTLANLILKYQKQFRMLEQEERNIHGLADREDSFWLEYSPALYGIDMFDKVSITAGKGSPLELWLTHAPTVFLCAVFDPSSLYQKTMLATEEETASWLDKSKPSENLHYFPARLCACMILGESYGNFLDAHLKKKIKLIEEQGYRVEGDIIGKVFFINKKGGKYYAYHRVWIPIEKF